MKRALLLGLGVVAVPAAFAQQRPNIIYIMCDDMGYGDLGCYGQQYIATPNIDRLASQGMRFTQAYAGSPVSAPSRACFMTGQHSGHTHVRGNREYWNGNFNYKFQGANGNVCTDYSVIGQEPYATDHVIIPEIFKKEGYATGMFGKWAGGYYNLNDPLQSSPSTPDKRGIDCFYGPICQFQAHTYYPNFLNRYDPKNHGDKHVVVDVLEENIQHKDVASGSADYENRTQYSADLIHQYALRWLDQRAAEVKEDGTPFLGIFTYTLPHAELWQPRDSILAAYDGHFRTEHGGGNTSSWYKSISNGHAQFAAMVTRLDAYVGEIMAKLEEKGLADNTVLIFTSDNGPHEEGGADPDFFNRDGLLKGKKRSTYEGGIRVPFIVRWPGTVKPGSVSDHMLAFYDLMATFSDIAGVDNYKKYNPKGEGDYFDGISFFPTLTGKGRQEEHDHLYWEFHETNMLGVRQGNWKLVVSGGNVQGLYDLATDIHEDTNLASRFPDKVKELKAIIKKEHTDSDLFQVTIPN